MINVTTGKLVLWALCLTALYIMAACFVPMALLIDVLNGMFLGIAVAVSIVYLPLIFFSLKENNFGRGVQLSVGIGLLWFSIIMARAWSSYYRYRGSPPELLEHPVIGYFIFLAFLAGCLFVTAPGYYAKVSNAKIPFGGRNRILLAALAFIGGALAVFIHYR